MTHINVYDDTAKSLEKLSEKLDVSEATIIDALITAVEDGYIDITEYV